MFTELIDTLRCPVAHEDSWLVATSSRRVERHIMDGRLGCPVCRSTFPIVDGVVCFREPGATTVALPTDDDTAFRLAAQLHLVESGVPILLVGEWSCAAPALLGLNPTLVMFIGDTRLTLVTEDRVSVLRLPDGVLPLATGSLRGVALDTGHATPAYLAESARVVRAGGRLVAPLGCTLDTDAWTALAADDVVRVAERRAVASAPVQLRRAPTVPLFDA